MGLSENRTGAYSDRPVASEVACEDSSGGRPRHGASGLRRAAACGAARGATERGLRWRTGAGRVPAGHSDRKSTRLNSSHVKISYAVFCLKKKIAKKAN